MKKEPTPPAVTATEPTLPQQLQRTQAVQDFLDWYDAHGPLYLRVVLPTWATIAYQQGRHDPIYAGHTDSEMLSDSKLESYVPECFQPLERAGLPNALVQFSKFLESKGYIIFPGAQPGYCSVPISGGKPT